MDGHCDPEYYTNKRFESALEVTLLHGINFVTHLNHKADPLLMMDIIAFGSIDLKKEFSTVCEEIEASFYSVKYPDFTLATGAN
jgi:hypothetical protein